MTIKARFILYIIFLHLIMLILGYFLFKEDVLYFILWECLILLSIGLSVGLYNGLVRPILFLKSGAEALKDQDYTLRYKPLGVNEMDSLIEVYNSMIDQLRKERTQQQAQHYFLEKLIEASPTGLIIMDFNGRIKNINQKALTLLDDIPMNDLMDRKFDEISIPLLSEIGHLSEGESQTIKVQGVRHFKCQKATFVDQGFKRQFITISELSEDILESEKKAYGKVIRMMAHEVNNSLGAINSMLQSISSMKVKGSEQDQLDYATALDVAVNRNRRLTKFVRNFADIVKLPSPEFKLFELDRLMKDCIQLMRSEASSKNINIECEENEKPLIIKGDIDQLELVIINVLKNAIESIEVDGTIVCSVTKKGFIIADSGKGILPEIEKKIFTPFFSSKSNGQGIGLTMTREILSNHKAKFSLKTIGEWTYFTATF